MKKKKRVLVLVAVLLLVAGMVGYVLLKPDKKSAATDVVTYSTDSLDEEKPNKDTYKWQGQPTDPKFITMPTINGEGFIQKVGVDQNKQIAVPGNVHVAGWFNQTVAR